ncbi:YeiH family protein [Magnetospirillum fulvum]|uniref:Conserved hypothetical integral membrane protein n=1 Tax=Magnetospirillum fulvum TaxID=1082 RepID=A0A1H6I2G1_MAGFU|nr:putative sulfate exporter family transporter [Magnetospirillum fulvum]SEH40649.1 conserved hypothetical integral membrane protein [Magnetospirillum fulvum]
MTEPSGIAERGGAAIATLRTQFPGLLAAATVGLAASFLSDHYGGPTMLYALLLGMAFHFLSQEGRCVEGIATASRTVLRIGVALLGMRITLGQIAELGLETPLLMVVTVAFTTLVGVGAARLMGLGRAFGVLTGGAVAVCGASAALAIAAVLPRTEQSERDTIFTVIGVTTLSTVAMILYPMIVSGFGLGPNSAGIFLGGTIHDVAQVVGAGYSLSTQTGDTATFVKLLRVAMLLPIVMVVSLAFGVRSEQGKKPPLLPLFLVAFAVLVGINSTGWVPALVTTGLNDLSRWCLVTAIAALGMKTSLKAMTQLGPKPVILLLVETVLMAALVLAVLLVQGGTA